MTPRIRLAFVLDRLWDGSKPLTATGVLMTVVLIASIVGIFIDPRIITGMPAWLKPAKFAISTAIYSFTLAWIFTYLSGWNRVRLVVGWLTAVVFVLEVGIIDMQAWRGTTSHFNTGTILDATLFGVMGSAIVIQTLSTVWVAVALWREPFTNRALGWALRLGMVITIVGASSGGLMTRPTSAQLARARVTGHLPISGAHTVGAPDGGAGLPGTGWSLDRGDLRIPHFVGLHALQFLPLVALVVARATRHEHRRVRLVVVSAASYVALFAILMWQALRGQSVFAPDATAMLVFGTWLTATAASVYAVARLRVPSSASRTTWSLA